MAQQNRQKKAVSRRKLRETRPKTLKRATAIDILGVQDECELWNRLLHSEDDRVVLTALKYLTDRRDGKMYPAGNPSLGDQAQFPERAPRPSDPKIAAALRDLLPPPSAQVTVGQTKDLTTD